MSDSIAQYFTHSGPDCKRRLTEAFSREAGEFAYLTSKLQETLSAYSSYGPQVNSARHVAFGLMKKGVNTLMAGFELALSGYSWEPPVLYRSAFEGFSAAWDVVHNTKRFALWQGAKAFDSTGSISNLSKEDDIYGKLWGHLSKMNVHTTQLNSSPAMFLLDGRPTFQVFGLVPDGKEEARRHAIEFSIFVAYVCLRLTEIVFHQFVIDPETISKTAGEDFVRTKITSRHRAFMESFERTCRTMMLDPNSHL